MPIFLHQITWLLCWMQEIDIIMDVEYVGKCELAIDADLVGYVEQ